MTDVEFFNSNMDNFDQFTKLMREFGKADKEGNTELADSLIEQMDLLAETVMPDAPDWCQGPVVIDGEYCDEPRVQLMVLIARTKGALQQQFSRGCPD